MSNTGLNTNTFHITGRYLEVLSDFVVKTKIDEDINEGRKEQLIEFFSKLMDRNNAEPQFQLLSSIIERELRGSQYVPQTFFHTLIDEINDDNTEAVLPKIELVIEALDGEHSDAMSKIRGE